MTLISDIFKLIFWPFIQVDRLMIKIADLLTYNVFGITPESHLGGSVHFFICDSMKIIILLSFMIFTISLIRSFFPPERVKLLLNKTNGLFKHLLAASLGVLSPFCSCSTVPIFIGFVESGIPLGVTFTFLVTSPIVNEIAIGFLIMTFGLKIAVIYTIAGMCIGMFSGYLIDKLHLEHLVESYIYEMQSGETIVPDMTWQDRIEFAVQNVKDITGRVWKFVLIGIGIGALVHGYAPADILSTYAGPDQPLAVFIAVATGIPLYSNAVGTIPIVEALILKGVGVGTALAFMMSVVALSLPEIILLKQVIKPKLIGIFVGITGFGILTVGYLFNIIL
ncbi:permease [Fusibacter sp. JL216-2]|uniref:permease n=1 Tax=Fusibacter sp. JL216-2 TaxID=3071453 RepID=UPI003D348C3F